MNVAKYALPHQLKPGTMLHGKYVLEGVLGEGGFGITYKGRDTTLDIPVAIKEYYPVGVAHRNNTHSQTVTTNSGRPEETFTKGKDSFLNEARVLAKFSREPGIVSVGNFFNENNTAYIVMEFLEGITLKSWLKNNGNISADYALDLLRPVMRTLANIHQQELIHRDISPDNIMLMPDGTLKLLDFGAARTVSNMDEKSLSVMLKPGYAPEEQYRSRGAQGPWTDVYALCTTIYKCITGITPDDATQRSYRDEVKPPSQLGAKITPAQEAVLLKGMAVLQVNRYQNIQELVQAFHAASVAVDIPVPPVVEEDANKTVLADEPEAGSEPEADSVMSGVAYAGVHNHEVSAMRGNDAEVSRFNHEQARAVPPPIRDAQTPNFDAQNPIHDEKYPVGKPQPPIRGPENPQIPKKKKKKRRGLKIVAGIFGGLFALIAILIIWAYLGDIGDMDRSNRPLAMNEINNERMSVSFNREPTPEELTQLANMPYLNNVSLSYNGISNETLTSIGQITNITRLSLGSSGPSHREEPQMVDLSLITGLYNLEMLSIIYVANADLSPISELNRLHSLTVIHSPISGLSALVDLPRFNTLVLTSNPLDDISDLTGIAGLQNVNFRDTYVSDLTPLRYSTGITTLAVSNTRITSLDGVENMRLSGLLAQNNQITDISALADVETLRWVNLSNNNISDISALANKEALQEVRISNNQVSDLSPLMGGSSLRMLLANNNNIQSLNGLQNTGELRELQINNNNISNLDELYGSIRLEIILAANNGLTCIAGLVNVTQLTEVNFNNGQISDISLLAQSAEHLTSIQLVNNEISDISALADMQSLALLALDGNNITNISPLGQSPHIINLFLHNNNISDISALAAMYRLVFLDLSGNQISDISAIENVAMLDAPFVLDISSNNISDISSIPSTDYAALFIYNNPIMDYSRLDGMVIRVIGFTYHEGADYSPLVELQGSRNMYAVDTPLARRVNLENLLGRRVEFVSTYEITEFKQGQRDAVTGRVDPAEEDNDGGGGGEYDD